MAGPSREAKSPICKWSYNSAIRIAVDAVFLVDRQRITFGTQPAFGLGEMQADGVRGAAGGEELAKVIHMGARLVLVGQLLQRDQRGRERLGDDPGVMARDSRSWHRRSSQP